MHRKILFQVIRSAVIAGFLILPVADASAQYVVRIKSGLVQDIQGSVRLDGRLLSLSKGSSVRMKAGQMLHTEQGFAEVLLGFNAYLRMGVNSLIRLERDELDDTQLSLEQGSVLIEIVEEIKSNPIRVRVSEKSVEMNKPGLYRVSALPPEVRVYGGVALVVSQNRKTSVKRGRMARLDQNSRPAKFNADVADTLQQWAARRSFDLFIVDESSGKQSHWMPVSLGWFVNSNYRMRFYSSLGFAQWQKEERARQREEARQEAARLAREREQEALESQQELARQKKALDDARPQAPITPAR